MKHLVLILLLFADHLSVLRAEPFEQAEVKKAINVVSLLPQDVRAAPGDIVEGDTALQTGGYSRAELQFRDLTITRVLFGLVGPMKRPRKNSMRPSS